jgi:hypothetical protein
LPKDLVSGPAETVPGEDNAESASDQQPAPAVTEQDESGKSLHRAAQGRNIIT